MFQAAHHSFSTGHRAPARERAAAELGELDLGLEPSGQRGGGLLPVTSSRVGCLLGALARGYDVPGLGAAAGSDEVFRDLEKVIGFL
jgi:hypothetical protein